MSSNPIDDIFSCDENTRGEHALKWQPGCPLQLVSIRASRNWQTGQAFLDLKVRNVSAEVVSAFDMNVVCDYEDGRSEELFANASDVSVAAGGTYELPQLLLAQSKVLSAAASVSWCTAGGGMWEPSGEKIIVDDPRSLDLTRDEAAERERLLLDRGVNPSYASAMSWRAFESHGSWAQCACGQVNVGRSSCCRCGMPFDGADEIQNKAYLDQRIQERVDKAAAKKKHTTITVAVAALAVVLVGAGIYVNNNIIQPSNAYNEAEALLEAGEFDAASSAFLDLGDYADAATRADEAAYGAAEELLSEGEYDEASFAFKALGDYEDAAQRATEAATAAAEEALDAGKYEDAVERFEALGLSDRANEAKYQYVKQNYNNENLTTEAYLDELIAAGYSDASELSDALYAWNVEFTMCSWKDWKANDEGWCSSSSFEKPQLSSVDSAVLLARGTGGRPNETKKYTIEGEYIIASTQLVRDDDWHLDSEHLYSFEVDGTGVVKFCAGGTNLYRDAWRFTVTDSETGEVVYTGELHAE